MSDAHKERTRGANRNARRKLNRAAKTEGRLLTAGEIRCACFGAIDGIACYGVRPAICGHWFSIVKNADGSESLGLLRGMVQRTGGQAGVIDFSEAKPIRSLEKGKRTPFRASAPLSFKRASVHALKHATKTA